MEVWCFTKVIDMTTVFVDMALREKCLYTELFWSVFSRIRTEYEETLRISPYSVRLRENMDKKNSEYLHFLRSVELYRVCKFMVASSE